MSSATASANFKLPPDHASPTFAHISSANGADFFDGFILDPATGVPDLPNLPRFKGYTNYDNYVGVASWTTIGINNTDYNDQGAFNAGTNRLVPGSNAPWSL